MKKNTQTALSKPGKLFLIGGKARFCLKKFVEIAGGASAKILVIAHASSVPLEVSSELSAELVELGVSDITCAVVGEPLVDLRHFSAIYLTGGDQEDLVSLLGKEGAAKLRRFYRKGGLIAGTSAGAAAVGCDIIVGGMADKMLRHGALRIGKGLRLLANVIVDTHFLQRSRTNRLVAAAHLFPRAVGIGLDEDTGLLIEGALMTVFGLGHVWIFKGGQAIKPSMKKIADQKLQPDFLYSVRGTTLSVLSSGEVYALAR